MKKLLTMALMLTICSCGITVKADTPDPVKVYVTIADEDGKLAMPQEEITVTDVDNDGALTINDALYLAHEAKYAGGASSGYESGMSEYGLSLYKLWGTAGTGFGYYVNNTSAWSLADTVKEGDIVSAFIYRDTTGWSDTYCYFNVNTVSAKEGEQITLTLSKAAFDANYNPLVLPVEGAAITIDGTASAYKTDAEGKVTITLDEGKHVISAVSDIEILVPPVCKADVAAKVTDNTSDSTFDNTADNTTDNITNSTSDNTSDKAVETRDSNSLYTYMIIAAALTGAVIFVSGRRNVYEK